MKFCVSVLMKHTPKNILDQPQLPCLHPVCSVALVNITKKKILRNKVLRLTS